MTEIRAGRGATARRGGSGAATGARAKTASARKGPARKAPISKGKAPVRKADGLERAAWRRLGLSAALAAFWVLGGCGGGVSGEIGQACMTSGRDAASRPLCSCVQGVANQTLSLSDQRRAVRFFDDPDRAQETRTSDRPGDEAFWLRYRAFADQAAAICGG